MVSSSGFHECNVKPPKAKLAIEYYVICFAPDEPSFEPVAAYHCPKRVGSFLVVFSNLCISASEKCCTTTSSCAFEIEKRVRSLRYRMTHESSGAIKIIFFSVVD